ncbi:hypothetical protein [Spirosoma radiotolerans]|uniref:Uncharacterized protein n=1 Tax=Spirosoma radiotolerans TaxID=1379870 RepID=A0A0E3ZU39_9BACT|nr:hypothetical protein [Spirosoma radiotolerans]AKD54944.1 hypothetical protein SD10_08550 [Spirosoma radiotolerans]
MAKGCLIVIIVVISVPLFIWVLSFTVFSDEPATSEKMLEILNQESNNQTAIPTYIELLEKVNNHKKDVIESSRVKDTAQCFNFPLGLRSTQDRTLPNKILIICDSIASRVNKSVYLTVCRDSSVTLTTHVTDYKNYLYVSHKFYRVDSTEQYGKVNDGKVMSLKNVSGYSKERTVKGRYRYVVEVQDAFNYIDPNNFAPN